MIEENEKLRSLVLEACRGLAAYGLGSGIGGYVSVRYPNKPFFNICMYLSGHSKRCSLKISFYSILRANL